MSWYTKGYDYPVPRWKFPHRLKDENGKSYTDENAFNNRHKLGWRDVSPPPLYDRDTQLMFWTGVNWHVRDKFQYETEEANNYIWLATRTARNTYLAMTDWTQIQITNTDNGDSANTYGLHITEIDEANTETVIVDKVIDANTFTAWSSYRQELRDLPEKQDDPNNIMWPEDFEGIDNGDLPHNHDL